MDRDLARLYARAKKTTGDSAAFRQQTRAEWRQREQRCRDRECLVDWYAHRRQQLTETLRRAGQA